MPNRSSKLPYTAVPSQTGKTKAEKHKKSFHQWRLREGNAVYRLNFQELSNTHLLAHLLRNRTLADRLMDHFGSLSQIAEASIIELKQVPGVGPATAEILQTAFELSRRRADTASKDRPSIRNPMDVYILLRLEYQGQTQEMTKVVLLDTRNRVLKVETVFIGTLNFSILHPREIFQAALRQNAASIILTHNHPSGCTDPSPEDIEATKQIAKVGKLIDISLLDHVIVGDEGYISLKEANLL